MPQKQLALPFLMEGLQKIANRITADIILAALIMGAPTLMQTQTRFQIFGYPGLAILCFLGAAAGGFWRTRNAFTAVCHYILENPFKAELIPREKEWPFCSAVVPGYPALHPLQPDFWPKFWKLYLATRAPDAGNLKKPPP